MSLPADDKYALPWGRVTLNLCIHPKIPVPPACCSIRADKIITCTNMVCKQVERLVESVLIGVVSPPKQLAESQSVLSLLMATS